MNRIEVVIGLVVRDGRVLICLRRPGDHLAGYWEFPGGKRSGDESLEACLHRELAEELAIRVRPVYAFAPIDHDYLTVHVRLYPYLCQLESGEPRPLACSELRWVEPTQLENYRLPPANDQLIRDLLRRLALPLLISAPSSPKLGSSGD